jgi:hypothetical protein
MVVVVGAFDGRECGTMSGRDGGTTRVNAATIWHDEMTRRWCNERTTRCLGVIVILATLLLLFK